MQYLIAGNWPLKIWLTAVSLLCIFLAWHACQPTMASFRDWHFLILFVSVIVLAPVLGCFVSFLFILFILGPIYYARGRLNGAPFHEGDHVQILVGPHRGRVVRVYAIWAERNQVRVELGEQTKKGASDVFSYFQVCRAVMPNNSLQATAAAPASCD
jgi:phosphate/sulfate permease